jgi:mannose/cellobiose epimerase-like protein (N-acyl-D-glucosamine 2-epimerase family)
MSFRDAADIPFDEIRSWRADALAFWAERGVDRAHGGFLEELSFEGEPTACAFKRVRVQCRQVYVFSHAATLGWAQGEALSRMGCEYLAARARTPDGGWARLLSREGDVIDPAPDLYDLAFVLFAMAWRYKASRDPDALGHAHEVLSFVQARMRGPIAGFWHVLPPKGPRQQNPHMHLTEACLAAFDATQDQRFLDQAGELVDLFRRRLFDGRSLGERFAEDWRRLSTEEGQALEPGHHFEWAWILGQHAKLTGGQLPEEAPMLVAFAEQVGVDPVSQAVFDDVREDGAPLRRSSRAWTNAERIKGWLALFEKTGCDPRREIAAATRLLCGRYFAGMPRGAWMDQFDGQGRPMSTAVPASIVYHLFLAFSELLRLEPGLRDLHRSPA